MKILSCFLQKRKQKGTLDPSRINFFLFFQLLRSQMKLMLNVFQFYFLFDLSSLVIQKLVFSFLSYFCLFDQVLRSRISFLIYMRFVVILSFIHVLHYYILLLLLSLFSHEIFILLVGIVFTKSFLHHLFNIVLIHFSRFL